MEWSQLEHRESIRSCTNSIWSHCHFRIHIIKEGLGKHVLSLVSLCENHNLEFSDSMYSKHIKKGLLT